MKRTLNAIVVFSVFLPSFACSAQDRSDKPNVLILYADDLGYGDLSVQNPNSKITTPNLDALANSGMRFTDAHSSSGICTPSRYALLTGRYHWRDFHSIVGAMGKSVFKRQRLTMPEMFQQQGYTTAAIGKWHLGWDWKAIRKPDAVPEVKLTGKNNDRKIKVYGPEAYDWSQSIPDGPLAHGFDTYFGDTVINFPPYCWIENDRVLTAPDRMMDTKQWKRIKEGNWECRPGPMAKDWDPYQNVPTITRRGVEFIESQSESGKPWFLYFAFPSPHAPIIPNDVFDGKTAAGAYGDYVYETDDACGRLLAALEASGQAENTIVVFSADNGAEHYAYPRDKKYDHWSSEPFRGLKRDLYEGGHHVPFIVRWPSVTAPGSIYAGLVSQVDLMATFAEQLQFELPPDAAEDSHTILPALKGDRGERTVCVHNTWAKQYAIRQGDWLLVNLNSGYHNRQNPAWEKKRDYPAEDGLPFELYNLQQDIGQRNNLANKHPERVQQMQRLLEEIQQRGYSAPRFAAAEPVDVEVPQNSLPGR